MKNHLVPYYFENALGNYNPPNGNGLNYLNDNTKTAIQNAWDEFAFIDNIGRVWIISDKLHVILRTNPENAKYIVGGISDYDKYIDAGNLYIRGNAVFNILDYNIQNARGMQRENYLRFSELFYRAIRDCSRARELRAEFYDHIKNILPSLKQKRLNTFNIQRDELTGENICFQTCEFSHIRSVSLYPELSSLIENGLIVNKITHNLITTNNINDEEELKAFSNLQGWSIEWYNHYKLIA